MKRAFMMLLAAIGMFSAAAQAALPQAPEAAQTSVAQVVPAPSAQVSVPRLVQFSGTLKDSAARPVLGLASVTFAIYAEQDGGTALWSETQNVTADANGHYTAVLGVASPTGVPQELFGTGQSRWLGVQLARQPELPRVLLVSVPYALKAADAEMLGGQPASAFVTTQALAANNAHTTPANTSAPASTTAIITSAPQVTPTSPTGSGTTDFLPLWTSSTTLGNSGFFQKSGMIGLNTTTPAELLDVNGNSIWRGSFQLAPDHPATASSGFTSHSFQFQATSFNSSSKTSITNAFGFLAVPLGNNTSSTSAKLDLFYGPNGGALVDTGLSYSTNGIITFASGQTFPGTSAAVNELNLPNTSSPTLGVITLGGTPIINDLGSASNIYVGASAGGGFHSASSSSFNTGLGSRALFANVTGSDNTATGGFALASNLEGSGNTADGEASLANNVGGSNNTALGLASGNQDIFGSGNTFIGYEADASVDGLMNATAIGANSVVGASNSLILGSTGDSAVKVGIGTTTPASTLEVSSALHDETTGRAPIPTPAITLSNSQGGAASDVGINFITTPQPDGGPNCATSRIEALDNGTSNNSMIFSIHSWLGTQTTCLVPVMTIGPTGDVTLTGSLAVGGNLMKSSGSFKIDDPIAPSEKYLSHSFVESPDMMNIYNGNVVTNAKGFATVTMPAWFESLNGDFRYQLTTMGQFAQAMVASEIKDGTFTIRTDKPNVKVSWQVTGIRHDAWANAHRIPTEELKPANEQGHYLHPELFDAGPDKAISAANHPHSKAAPALAGTTASPVKPDPAAATNSAGAAHNSVDRASAPQSGGASH
jgi:hypothetical protein